MELKELIAHARQIAENNDCDAHTCAYQHDCLVDCLEELQRYRDTGLAPEGVLMQKQLYKNASKYEEAVCGNEFGEPMISPDQLREVIQANLRGCLLILPFAPGATLYRIDLDPQVTEKVVTPFIVDNIVICSNGEVLLKYDSYDGVICTLDSLANATRYLDYYRTFLTYEEAQRGLEGGVDNG